MILKKRKEKLTTTLFKFLPGWVVNQSKIILKSELLHVHRYIYIYIFSYLLLPFLFSLIFFTYHAYAFNLFEILYQHLSPLLAALLFLLSLVELFLFYWWYVLLDNFFANSMRQLTIRHMCPTQAKNVTTLATFKDIGIIFKFFSLYNYLHIYSNDKTICI